MEKLIKESKFDVTIRCECGHAHEEPLSDEKTSSHAKYCLNCGKSFVRLDKELSVQKFFNLFSFKNFHCAFIEQESSSSFVFYLADSELQGVGDRFLSPIEDISDFDISILLREIQDRKTHFIEKFGIVLYNQISIFLKIQNV